MGSAYIQANTDGRLHAATKPSISPLDRGYLYGDAVYEVWRTYDGVVFAWEEHAERLSGSARALGMALPFTFPELFREIQRTAAAYGRNVGRRPELYIRLQVTRGAGAIGLNTRYADRPRFVLLVQALKVPTAAQKALGLKLAVAQGYHRNHPATLNPLWKTGNYLNNILCLREAIAAGADEVVITNLAGEITEAAVANICFVRDGVLWAPPLSAGMLAGITRSAVLGPVARAAKVSVRETTVRPEDLKQFSECFLTGTTREIHPVRAIDGRSFRVGGETITARLQRAYRDYTRAYVAAHPHQQVWRYPARSARG